MGIVESSWRKQVRVGEEVDITLIGGREMRGRVLDIDGCAGVLACDDNIIRLRLKDTVLTVLGSNLQALDFSAYTLTVTGDIRSIELEPLPKRKGAGK